MEILDKNGEINRGLYIVINKETEFKDRKKDPNYLTIPKGAIKIGKSLELDKVKNRYEKHSNVNIETHILIRLRDRDDIDILEKKFHKYFDKYRLINSNKRKVEWLNPESRKYLSKSIDTIVFEHFQVLRDIT